MKLFMCVVVSCMFMSGVASAGSQEGMITRLIARDDGLHFFYLSGSATDSAPCAVRSYWMIKDENSAVAKSQWSMLLAAHMAKATVRVTGTNGCTRWSDGEDVSFVELR